MQEIKLTDSDSSLVKETYSSETYTRIYKHYEKSLRIKNYNQAYFQKILQNIVHCMTNIQN